MDNFMNKLSSVRAEIESSLINYPNPKPSFSILFASRESCYDFHLGEISRKGTFLYTYVNLNSLKIKTRPRRQRSFKKKREKACFFVEIKIFLDLK